MKITSKNDYSNKQIDFLVAISVAQRKSLKKNKLNQNIFLEKYLKLFHSRSEEN